MRSFREKLTIAATVGIITIALFYSITEQIIFPKAIKKSIDALTRTNINQIQLNINSNIEHLLITLKYYTTEDEVQRFIVDDSKLNENYINKELSNIKLLGHEVDFFVVNSLPEVVYQSNKKIDISTKNEIINKVSDLFDSDIKEKIYIEKSNDMYYLFIVAPIDYRDHTEGLLIARLNAAAFFSKTIGQKNQMFGTSFHINNEEIFFKGKKSETTHDLELTKIPDINIRFFIPKEQVYGPLTTVRYLSIVFSLFIMIVFILLVKFKLIPFLVTPLREFQSKLEQAMSSLEPIHSSTITSKEVEQLRNTFNGLIVKLKDNQDESMSKAHKAGMAENAIAVLHNIGNLLTAVLVKIENEESSSRILHYCKGLQRYKDEVDKRVADGSIYDYLKDDPKGSKLQDFLQSLINELKTTATNEEEAHNFFRDKIVLVSEIITTQQNVINGDLETVSDQNIMNLFRDTIKTFEQQLEKQQISITENIDETLFVTINKYAIIQVLTNIIKNSIEAINEHSEINEQAEKHIEINASKENHFALISITDTGVGIKNEDLSNLFQFSYSTKNRNSGFGLHNCANEIKKEGGQILIESEGYQKGATVKIRLPLSKND